MHKKYARQPLWFWECFLLFCFVVVVVVAAAVAAAAAVVVVVLRQGLII